MAAAAVLLLLVVATQCQGPEQVPVRPPDGDATGCAELEQQLPAHVNGDTQVSTKPSSPRTAAWGSPAIILRCGVQRPAGLEATSEVLEVNGVEWFLDERPEAYVFTTVGRQSYVELRVPIGIPREAATAPLVDMAGAIKATVPQE